MRGNGTVDESPTTRRVPDRPKKLRATDGNGTGHPPDDRIDERRLLAVLSALKKGNFSVRLPVEWTGLAGKVSDTLNDVIELNQKMANELARLSKVVGKEGKINHRASIGEFTGSWAATIGSVNTLIGDLVHPTSEMARVIGAVAKGDLSQ